MDVSQIIQDEVRSNFDKALEKALNGVIKTPIVVMQLKDYEERARKLYEDGKRAGWSQSERHLLNTLYGIKEKTVAPESMYTANLTTEERVKLDAVLRKLLRK